VYLELKSPEAPDGRLFGSLASISLATGNPVRRGRVIDLLGQLERVLCQEIMEGTDEGRQVDRPPTNGHTVPGRLLIDHLRLTTGHLHPMLLGDGGVVCPALVLLSLLLNSP